MQYRDPDTGHFISREEYEQIIEENREFDYWEDWAEFETFDEDEYLA